MSAKQFTPTMTTAQVVGETPSGTQDYTNTTFTLVNAPAGSALKLYVNNVRMIETTNYTVSGKTITMVEAPSPNDVITADYSF